MSYYPQPYNPPPHYNAPAQYPPPAPNAPATRAAIFMWIVGGLSLICGMCMGGSAAILSEEVINQSPNASDFHDMLEKSHMTLAAVRVFLGMMSVSGLLVAILFIVLAFYVRRGSGAAIITALIFSSLGLLMSLIGVVAGLFGGEGGAICMSIVGLALYATLVILLIQALRANSPAALEAHYQHQYWQYQQQQQYAQQYGYPPQQQLPPVPMPPPPPPGSGSLPPPPSFDNAKREEPPEQQQ